MAFTYDDFISKMTSSGMSGQFSDYDLNLAKQFPEFGLSMLTLKQDYSKATTDQARALANSAANQLRTTYGNYTGGKNGADYYSTAKPGDFLYENAPTYNNEYESKTAELLDNLINRKDFSYNKNKDPSYAAYKKEYLREGDRATSDALAKASAASGGIPSSYAQTAATQAGDYYATQLSDKVPTLYQQAYERYLNDFNMDNTALSAVSNAENTDYKKYLDEYNNWYNNRAFNYTDYLNQTNMDIAEKERLTEAEQQKFENTQQKVQNALSIWQTNGYATKEVSDVLGVKVGTPTSDQSYNDWYKAYNANKSSVSSGSGSSGSSRSSGSTRSSGSKSGSGSKRSSGTKSSSGNSLTKAAAAFNNGNQSDAIIKQLLSEGYTKNQLISAGYKGSYFSGSSSKTGTTSSVLSSDTKDMLDRWYKANTSEAFERLVAKAIASGTLTKEELQAWQAL